MSALVAAIRREDELQLGAAGRLLIRGEINTVHPADNFAEHAAANPLKRGQLQFDVAANRAIEEAIAKNLLAAKEAVVILGGEHNLSSYLPDSEYVHVTVAAYKQTVAP